MATDILVKIGADISDFSKKMAESNKALQNFNQANQQTFDSFKKVGAVVTGAGVAIAGGLGLAVKTAANFESAMSSVAAISGATGEDFDLLSAKAREMGASTSFSATDSAKALEFMALAGWNTQQMLGGIEPILHLAEAGALDLGRASDLVTDSMAALGLKVTDLDGYLDKVAKTAASSNTDIDALMEAMVIAGGTFERFNVPLEEANAFLGVMANRGFKGSEAGTALNAIMARLTSGTGQAADALEELGISAFDSEGNFKGMEVVMREVKSALDAMDDESRAHYQTLIAGLNHGKAFSAMMNGLGDEYDGLKASIADSNGALREMRDIMKDNLQGALENLNSAFEEILISLGTALLPAVKQMTEWLQKLADWFNNLSDSTKTTIAILAGIASVFALITGPILLLIGFVPHIIAGFTAVMTVLKAVGAAIALLTSPVALVVAAVIAAAALIYIYWEPISEFFINLWESVKEIGISVWESLKEAWNSAVTYLRELFAPVAEFFVNLWNGVVEVASEIWGALTETLSTVWQNIKTIASSAWELIKNAVLAPILLLINLATGDMDEFKSNLSAIWENIKNAAKRIFDSILNIVTSVMDGIKSVIDTVWRVIEKLWTTVLETIANAVGVNFEDIRSNIQSILDSVKSIIDSVWSYIKNTFINVLNFLKSLVTGDFEGMNNAIKAQMENIKSTISSIWEAVKTIFSNLISAIVTVVKQKFTDIVNSVHQKMDETKAKVEEGWNKAKAFLEGIDLRKIGEDIIQGLINGIKNKVSDVINAVKDVADAITDKIKSVLKIASPSKVTTKYGENTTEGLTKGIKKKQKEAEKAAKKAAQAVAKRFKEAFDSTSYKFKVGAIDSSEYIKSLETVRKNYAKTGEQIRKVNLEIKKAQEKQAKEIAKKLKAEYEASKNYIEKKKRDNEITLEQELILWEKVQGRYKAGTKQRIDAEKQVYKVKQEIAKQEFEASKQWIERQKKYNGMALEDEYRAWERIQNRYKVGSKEREEAEEQVYRVKKELYDKLMTLEDEYLSKMQAVSDEYEKAVDDRAKSLYNFANLFDDVDLAVKQSGQELVDNLAKQVSAMKSWEQQMNLLAQKGVDEGLLAELREMGPKALPQLVALNELTNEKLTQYSDLYREKSQLARDQAERELIGMKEDAEQRLTELQKEWETKAESIRKGTAGEFNVMKSDLNDIGKQSMQGMINGLESMRGELMATAQSIANAVKATMASALQIHSPSRWMRDMIGKNMMLGWIDGMNAMKGAVIDVANKSVAWMTPSVPPLTTAYDVPIAKGVRIADVTNDGDGEGNGGGFNPSITNYFTPAQSTPAESARQQELALRRMALERRSR